MSVAPGSQSILPSLSRLRERQQSVEPHTWTVRKPTPSTIPQKKQSEVLVAMELILSAWTQEMQDNTRNTMRLLLPVMIKT